jgi:ABC-type multidrug transport system ATPase subunit
MTVPTDSPNSETKNCLNSIQLIDAGKRFNREWIFRSFQQAFLAGSHYAITGPNGSGKSTLLQAIAGSLQLSEGTMEWKGQTVIEPEQVFLHLAIAAPYLELIEEMTAREFLEFHSQFKPLIKQVTIPEILSLIGLEKAANKQIRFFSSGMKQRVKLAQAIFADVPVLLLDEPCTNLDQTGYTLYRSLINEYCSKKLIIVSSNDPHEYDFCKTILRIQDYKQ